MKRLETWRIDFYAAIEAHRPARFAWGEHDCAILTADCVRAVAGLDPAQAFRGRYSTEAEGQAALEAAGYRDPIDVLKSRFTEIHPSRACVGDIAIVVTEHGPATAPVVGSEVVVFAPAGHLGQRPLSDAVRAFRIEIKEEDS